MISPGAIAPLEGIWESAAPVPDGGVGSACPLVEAWGGSWLDIVGAVRDGA